jgi:hypothetical protein
VSFNTEADYPVAGARYGGFKRGAKVPQQLSSSDLERVVTSDVYRKPLTHVCFALEGIGGLHCYCYLTRK